MSANLFDKVWDLHKVGKLPSGRDQLFIGLHLVHEVTSPQAFAMLAERGLSVAFPERSFATCDHIVPTDAQARPFKDPQAEAMMAALEANTASSRIEFFGLGSGRQGIVHVIGPELGLTQPGMTIACGDSHTSTHGAFGAIAFGIGTSQVRDVLATQTLAMDRPRVRRINAKGALGKGVGAKDLILYILSRLGVEGGIGYAYEYSVPLCAYLFLATSQSQNLPHLSPRLIVAKLQNNRIRLQLPALGQNLRPRSKITKRQNVRRILPMFRKATQGHTRECMFLAHRMAVEVTTANKEDSCVFDNSSLMWRSRAKR